MRCPHCGAELEAGSIYCEICGQELQIVPDYDPLDEWIVGQDQTPKEAKNKEELNTQTGKGAEEKTQTEKSSSKVISRVYWLFGLLLLGFLAFLAAYYFMSRESSYAWQLEKGVDLVEEEKYQEAIPYLKQAQNLQSNTEGADITPLRYLAKAYAGVDSLEMAVSCMENTIRLEEAARGNNYALEELYLEYMEILNQARQTSRIEEVIEACEYEEIQEALEPYRIEKPSCDTHEGTYNRYVSLELEAEYGSIYYTLDGTEPTAESTRYEGAIELQEEGEVLLTAAAINKKGMISDKLVLVYRLEFNNVYGVEDL